MLQGRPVARRMISVIGAAVVAVSMFTACASDGKTLRPPVYPLPEPPVTSVPAADRVDPGVLPFVSDAAEG